MSRPATRQRLRATACALAGTATLAALSGCGVDSQEPDLIAGKQLFVERCGSCHVLGRAGTKGTQGPDLDEAFQQSIKEGFGEDAVRGVIQAQILNPSRLSEDDKAFMPAKLVDGQHAEDVASYVASVVSKSGKDTGLLATAVKQAGGGEPAVAKDSVLEIAADPAGQLAYVTDTATAPQGKLTIQSPNKSGTPHNIALEGGQEGEVVQDGGVSKISVALKAGKFTFLCTVPGHAEAGMKGTLTVK